MPEQDLSTVANTASSESGSPQDNSAADASVKPSLKALSHHWERIGFKPDS